MPEARLERTRKAYEEPLTIVFPAKPDAVLLSWDDKPRPLILPKELFPLAYVGVTPSVVK